MKQQNIKWIVTVGMLGSIGYLLMLLEFPLIPMVAFLKMDFSDVPVLIATFVSGPLAGVFSILLKNTLHYFMTGSATGVPVGHFSNVLAGLAFVLPTYYVYKHFCHTKGLIAGLGISTVFMALFMGVANYFIVLPAYSYFLGLDISMLAPDGVLKIILYGIIPFNLVKGTIVSSVFVLVYNRMSSWILRQNPILIQ